MTPDEAKAWLKKIYMQRADDEAAHNAEDEARQVFLRALADGFYPDLEEAMDVAEILLESDKYEFERWCA